MLSKSGFYLFWGNNEADYVLQGEPNDKGGFCHLEEVALLVLALIVCMLFKNGIRDACTRTQCTMTQGGKLRI